MPSIDVVPVTTRRDLRAFVQLPWRIYEGDRSWVPPLISERLDYLDPKTGPFYTHADIALFLARRDHEVVGTVACFVDHKFLEAVGRAEGGFGFFESVNDLEVARRLLSTARDWLRARGMTSMRGPTSFSDNDCPGVVIERSDCPPVMLQAHTPRYYPALLERCGMEKAEDLYAWRAFQDQIGREMQSLPPQLLRVAEAARTLTKVQIRRLRMDRWDEEIATAYSLFTETLHNTLQRAPYSEAEFSRIANQMKPFIDPDLALYAEAEGRPVGFLVAVPDVNQVLIRLNGRISPLAWYSARRAAQRINVVTFKLMGVKSEYRKRGIDALLYLEAVRSVFEKGYSWLDGSVTSELNTVVNLIASRLGAERYKHYRLYQMKV